MEPRITLITLGVSNLAKAVAFYREGLGWPSSYKDGEEVAFFDLRGTKLGLYGMKELCADISPGTRPPAPGFSGVTLAHNVRTREEVGAALAAAERAGGRILKPAQDVFWGGHAGYFTDPDGHHWEVAWNPVMPLGDGGEMVL